MIFDGEDWEPATGCRWWLVAIAALSIAAIACAANAQSPLTNFPTVGTAPSVYPLPDPALRPQYLWITQSTDSNPAHSSDYKIDPLQLGYTFVGPAAPHAPFQYQTWIDTSTSPVVLRRRLGSNWVAETSFNPSGSGSIVPVATLLDAHLFVGNSSNVAADVAVSGDLSLSDTGAFTINNGAVTTAKLADGAVTSIKIANGAVGPSQLAGGATGITQLTGDIQAGPGTGSQVATLPNIVAAGTNLKITYNAKGQVISGSGAACSDLSNAGPGCTGGRTPLTADTSYYIATTGSDSNNCLASLTACATLNHVWSVLTDSVDLQGHIATVNIAGGTYAPLVAGGVVQGATGASDSVRFVGDLVTPTNVNIVATNANAVTSIDGALFTIRGVHLTASGTGASQGTCLLAFGRSTISFDTVNFGACDFAGYAVFDNAIINVLGSYTVSGGGETHAVADSLAVIHGPATAFSVTLTGTPNFSVAFAFSDRLALLSQFATPIVTFVGAATGPRYSSSLNAIIDTNGGGSTFLPGNSGGSTSTGGQYN